MNPPSPLPYAPRRNRPLSLWNPLDYLVLLYWVFYFPQALRWYVKTLVACQLKPTAGRPYVRTPSSAGWPYRG